MKKILSLLTLLLCVCSGAWADTEPIYSWTGAAEGANQTGGSIKSYATDGGEETTDDINVVCGSFYTIRLRGANNFSSNVVKITLDEALKAGDVIKVTACRNKNVTGKTSGFKAKFNIGSSTIGSSSGKEFVNINSDVSTSDEYGTEPNTCSFDVPNDAAGSTVITMTRSHTSTNLFVSKIEIVRPVATAPIITTQPVGAQYALNATATALSVVATASAGTLSYQWYSNTTESTQGATAISGAINAEYTPSTATESTTYYYCVVTDGNGSVTSDIVAIKVVDALAVKATFSFDTGVAGQVAVVSADNVFSVTSVGVADMTYAGIGADQGITGTKMQPISSAKDDKSQYTKFTVTPKKGITFIPKKVTFDAMRWGTDGNNKLHYYAESGSTSNELGNVNPNRNGKGSGWSHYEHEISGIIATRDNPFSLACYVYGLANNKQISFANIVIEGEYSGTAEDETMYSIATSVNPSGAGNIVQNPAGASLAEGTAVEFSATANTGYKFLNKWTVNGTEVEGATYSVSSLSADLEVVAQFKKLFAISFDAGEGEKGNTTAILTTEYSEGSYTTPAANYYIARDGYTVTGWTDGENTYGLGETITLTGDITLTPVFTKNTKTIADTGTSDVTVKYGFDNTKGDPVINLENSTGYYVKQAEFGGETIDVPMFIDNLDNHGIDGKRGKTNNVGRANAQINTGAKFTLPAVGGMAITINVANGSLEGTTIAGEAYSDTYTYNGSAESVDIIFTSDGLYINDVTVVYPRTSTTVKIDNGTGYRTFASKYPTDWSSVSGVTAYTASVSGEDVIFNKVTGAVPAREGLLLKADDATITDAYIIPVATTTPAPIENKFVGVIANTVVGKDAFVLYKDDTHPIGFYKTNNDAFEVGANTAYLPADIVGVNPSRTFIAIDDTATGISEVNATENTGAIYNLNGVRVEKATKGLYIINGKKVLK